MEVLNLNNEPDLVVIQVYITSAYRAYELAHYYRAKGAYIVLGGLHLNAQSLRCPVHRFAWVNSLGQQLQGIGMRSTPCP